MFSYCNFNGYIMKFNLTAFILLCLGIQFAFAQDINQFDADGERHGVWKKYYDNNRIRYEGTFEHGKEVGDFKFYSAAQSDTPIVIKMYNKENDSIAVQFFTEEGILESDGKMIGKERVGKWVYYHKDGKSVMIEEHYQDNIRNGSYKVFYPNGALTKSAFYKDDQLDGNSKKYSQEGVLIEDVNYKNGVLNGSATFYETNGNIKQKGIYENDLKVGVWEFYTDGELTKSKEVKVTSLD